MTTMSTTIVTSFDKYQELSRATADYPRAGKNIYYAAMGMVGEAGEVMNKIKKVMRDDNDVVTQQKREAIRKELGDVLWYMAQLATELDLKFSEIATENLQRTYDRKERGVLGGSGDDR